MIHVQFIFLYPLSFGPYLILVVNMRINILIFGLRNQWSINYENRDWINYLLGGLEQHKEGNSDLDFLEQHQIIWFKRVINKYDSPKCRYKFYKQAINRLTKYIIE